MSGAMCEVYRDGAPTGRLFLSDENAQLWIGKQTDGAKYEIFPFLPP